MKYFEYFFSTYLILILIFISCNKDYHPLGEPIFSDLTLETKNKNIPVFTYQQSVNQVQSNVQPLAQLGQINHPVFGVVQASIFYTNIDWLGPFLWKPKTIFGEFWRPG
ncbi:DUF4270 domain-containing protein [bacterium]|nr:DUF4270 domain-containing protein [bacterium]